MSNKVGRVHMRIEGDKSAILKEFSDSYGNTCIIHGFDMNGNMTLETHSSVNPDNGDDLETPISSFVAISPKVAIQLVEMILSEVTIHKATF